MNNLTGTARTTSAIPPRWSSCRWVSRTRSIPATRCARRSAVSVGPASRGPPSISTRLPVGPVTSAASPWPTATKSMRSRAGAGAWARATAGAAGDTPPGAAQVTAASSSQDTNQRRSSLTLPRYGHHVPEHKKSDRAHAPVSAWARQRCVESRNHERRTADNLRFRGLHVANFRLQLLRQWRSMDIGARPWLSVVQTSRYLARARKLLTDVEQEAIVQVIAKDPTGGVLIEGSGGIRKMRFGTGKGGRAVAFGSSTTFTATVMPAYLLTIFAKNEMPNLPRSEIDALADLAQVLKRSHGR